MLPCDPRRLPLRVLIIATIAAFVAGCGAKAPDRQTSPTPAPASSRPAVATIPLDAGWPPAGGGFARKRLTAPAPLDVCGIEPLAVPKTDAWRGVELDGPNDHWTRQVFVFGSAASAKKLVDSFVAHTCTTTTAEDGTTLMSAVTRSSGEVRLVRWFQLQGSDRQGNEVTTVVHSGRAVLVSTRSDEGTGKAAAVRTATADRSSLEPVVKALRPLGE